MIDSFIWMLPFGWSWDQGLNYPGLGFGLGLALPGLGLGLGLGTLGTTGLDYKSDTI